MTYEEQLLTPEWKAKREYILNRDNHECQTCMSIKNLHVHHKRYVFGRMAWDYENRFFITLCEECHGKFHTKEFDKYELSRNSWNNIISRLQNSYAAVYQLRSKEDQKNG